MSLCLGSGSRGGKILQRFPEKDWPDTPFIDGIEWFCQPLGWKLSTDRQEPQFFTSVLTDIDARHHYCACLSFNETVAITPSKPVDDEEEDISDRSSLIASGPAAITHHSVMYAPKCLVIVSKLNYLEVFKVREILVQLIQLRGLIAIYLFILELSRHNLHRLHRESTVPFGEFDRQHSWLHTDSSTWWSTSTIFHWSW